MLFPGILERGPPFVMFAIYLSGWETQRGALVINEVKELDVKIADRPPEKIGIRCGKSRT